jgi:hypothetical protein
LSGAPVSSETTRTKTARDKLNRNRHEWNPTTRNARGSGGTPPAPGTAVSRTSEARLAPGAYLDAPLLEDLLEEPLGLHQVLRPRRGPLAALRERGSRRRDLRPLLRKTLVSAGSRTLAARNEELLCSTFVGSMWQCCQGLALRVVDPACERSRGWYFSSNNIDKYLACKFDRHPCN